MQVIPTHLEGCFLVEPHLIEDERGYFMESFNQATFRDLTGSDVQFVQDNQSFSTRGVLRGLHYQSGASAQAKLVRVIQGEILDIAVDLRPHSATYGQYHSELLSGANQRQVFIPRGFAHGFLVLSTTALFFYKCDNYYDKESEGGIIYNDRDLNINWNCNLRDCIISEKDRHLPPLSESRAIW